MWVYVQFKSHENFWSCAGAIKGAKSLLATRLRSLQKSKGTAGFTFAIQVCHSRIDPI